MAEKTTALYRLVTIPALYRNFQNALGGVSARENIRKEFFDDVTDKRVLEVGCGPGSWVVQLHDVARYVGIDWNADHIKQASELHGSEKVTFLEGDVGAALDMGERSFDYVFAFGLLHHLDDAKAFAMLESTKQMVAPGGAFVSVDPVYHEGQNRFARWMNDRDSGQNIREPKGYDDLVEQQFLDVSKTICTDKLRIPYSHYIMTCRQPVES